MISLQLKRVFMLAAALVALTSWSATGTAKDAQTRPPNIIVILADDLGVESIGSYGSEISTPNLDTLAREGLQVENAHAMPICTPSRVRLLTGKDSSRNFRDFGHLDEGERTFAHSLRAAGYRTMVGGKWQLGNAWEATIPLVGSSPAAAGFDEYIVHNLTEQEVGSRYWGPTLYRNGRRERIEDRLYGPDIVNQAVLDFMDSNREKPFLIFYSMLEPHDPWVLTPEMKDPADKQERYRGMVRHLDTLVGTLVKKIDALGLRENTLIIFTSDNGMHPAITVRRHGIPVQGGKGTTTLRGTHVPFIAHWPGTIAPGVRSDALVDIADIAPTLAEIADQPLPRPVDGLSLLALFRDPRSQVHSAIAHTYMPTGRTPPTVYAFDKKYKLYADGQFFNLESDPNETAPIQSKRIDPGAQSARVRLKAILDALPSPVPFR